MKRSRLPNVVCLCSLTLVAAACTTFDTPTASTPATPPDPSVFAGILVRGGWASRDFTATAAGTTAITLTSVTPDVVIGVGIGIPRPDGGGCNLHVSMETAAGSTPQVSAVTGTGKYCVRVYDVGQVEESVTFSLRVTQP